MKPISLILSLASIAVSYADDAAPATVEQLQTQLAAKDQQIAQLQRQATEMQRDVLLYRQSFNACLDQTQRPALNPAQQRMMQQAPAKANQENGKP